MKGVEEHLFTEPVGWLDAGVKKTKIVPLRLGCCVYQQSYINVDWTTLVGRFCRIFWLECTKKVNSTFRALWLASSEVISQVLFTSEQAKKNKMAFDVIFSQIKLPFGPLVIQFVWYMLKQLFTSVSVKVVDIYLHFGEKLLSMASKKLDHRGHNFPRRTSNMTPWLINFSF